jgi:hypothetical protein
MCWVLRNRHGDGSKRCDIGVECTSRSMNFLLFVLLKEVVSSFSDSGTSRTAVGFLRTCSYVSHIFP